MDPDGDGARGALYVWSLTKEYDKLAALRGIDLQIHVGELVALLGHNGAGKSTLLGILAGLIEPTDGGVHIDGHPAGSLEARAALSYAGDTPILYDDLSVREHLEYIAGLHGVTDWMTAAERLIDQFDLLERADDLPARFSRGMRQKTALAIAFIRPSSVLLVDEPFVGLDVRAQAKLVDMLVAHARAGSAVIVATHQPPFLAHVDRCIMLHEGLVQHDGPPTDAVLEALRNSS